MPKLSFDPKISLGNILAIITMIGGLWGFAQAYGGIVNTVDGHSREIAELRTNAAKQAESIEADRLFMRETLAELRTDIRYIRRFAEEAKRGEVE